MPLVLLGAGAMSPEILWMVQACLSTGSAAGFSPPLADDEVCFYDEHKEAGEHLGLPLLRSRGELEALGSGARYLFAVGSPKAKAHFVEVLRSIGQDGQLLSLDAASGSGQGGISPDLRHGAGCLLFFNTHVSPQVELGDFVTVNFDSFIAHDCRIGDYTNVSSRATVNGNVKIGRHCHIGSGSVIVNNAALGDHVYVTVGSVVTKDVPDGMRVVGNPARYFPWEA